MIMKSTTVWVVGLCILTEVQILEEHIASIFRVEG
jgi:hypothetical protein